MGEVIRPWRFIAPSYWRWWAENKLPQIARDEALRARGIDPSKALRTDRRRRQQRRPMQLDDDDGS
jgi:hypothetical protein